jgi:preprotein translocase SecE subunit
MLDLHRLQLSVGFFITLKVMGVLVAEPETKVTAKRRVKDPETFRERAVKATAAQDKAPRRRPVRRTFSVVFGPIGRALRKLFRIQPFKAIGWVFKQIGKVVFPQYLRGSFAELKLVSWPSWRLSRRLTYAVLVFAVVFGAAIASVDYGLGKVFKSILLK